MLYKRGFLYCCCFFLYISLSGQDLHFSQFFHSPLNLNPGLTGVFQGDARFAANYRRQWKSVPVDYMTFAGQFDMKFYGKGDSKNFWSAGLLFDYDRAGELTFSTTKIAGAISYTYSIDDKNFITPGILLGYNQNRLNTADIRTGNQFNNGEFTGEGPEIPPSESNGYGNISAGINYRWQTSHRTHIDAGIGFYNLNTPNQSFLGSSNPADDLKIRMSYVIQGSFKVADKVDLLGNAFLHDQQENREWVMNAYGKLYLNKTTDRDIALLVGVGLRPSDAVYPLVGFQYRNIQASISYDINYSDFNIATDQRGGPELSFIYRLVRVPKAPFKPCPIY